MRRVGQNTHLGINPLRGIRKGRVYKAVTPLNVFKLHLACDTKRNALSGLGAISHLIVSAQATHADLHAFGE
jgi:hypothetical protein